MQPVDAQTLARVINLFVYILLIAISITIIPRGKRLLAFIGVLPVSVFLASSLSADSLNIAWNVLFVSYILRLYEQKTRATRLQLAIVFVLGLGLFMLKVAYVPILLLILALKPRTIKTKQKWILFCTIAILGSILYIIWSRSVGSLNSLVDVSTQARLILHHLPQSVAGVLLNILWLPMTLFDGPSMYIVIALIFVAIFIQHIKSIKLAPVKALRTFISNYRLPILGSVAVVGALALTYGALLLTWTNISVDGWTAIRGFQGRYVIPLLPLVLIMYYLPQKRASR